MSEKQAEQPVDETSSEPVSFEGWFTVKMKGHKRLQAHHLPVLQAFFKKNNLTELEPESKYDAMLKRYGY